MDEKILFTTDIFRISNNTPYFLDRWLFPIFSLFKEQIYQATGIFPIVNYSSDVALFDVKKFYKLCNYEYNEENWLKISEYNITPAAEDYFVNAFKNYFIIVYHANPVMLKLFQKHNIYYIDLYEGSIRFLEDIHFAMRSNYINIYKNLIKYQYPEEFIKYEANRLISSYRDYGRNTLNTLKLQENSLLLCGQTPADISLLRNGRYVSLSDFYDKFASIAQKYNFIYYKPHPYSWNEKKNTDFIKQFSDFKIINNPFYALMASPQITGVAALSSGVLKEAPYFGKQVHIISHLYIDFYNSETEININKFITLNTDYYSPTFWADILSPLFQTKECKYFNFNNNTNFLRENVFAYWGYDLGIKKLNQMNNKTNQIANRLETLENKLNTNKINTKFKLLRRIISIFIPNKKLRKKIRGI